MPQGGGRRTTMNRKQTRMQLGALEGMLHRTKEIVRTMEDGDPMTNAWCAIKINDMLNILQEVQKATKATKKDKTIVSYRIMRK